ncbi:hypothetical protein DFH11DRAFT_1723716 [Phellopilus nigrolimitatus]|nr:hypothetical protein DFH11DRAFT_1723716 [Phellopilus nigrolimitatus]
MMDTEQYGELHELDNLKASPHVQPASTTVLPLSHSASKSSLRDRQLRERQDIDTAPIEPESKTELAYLREMAGHLSAFASTREQDEREAKKSTKANYRAQAFSSLAVVSVFLASLAVAFLSLVNDTISDRDAGSQGKMSDRVTIALCYTTTIFSLIDTVVLGLLGLSPVFKEQADADDESDFSSLESGSRANRSTDSISAAPESASASAHGDVRDGSSFVDGKDWADGWSQYRTNMMKTSALFLVVFVTMSTLLLATETFLIALLVFVWAEQSLAVAIVATVSFLYSAVLLSTVGLLIAVRSHWI